MNGMLMCSVEFYGIHHYAVGSGQLTRQADTILVSAFGGPADGIGIDTGKATAVSIQLVPVHLMANSLLAFSLYGLDQRQRLRVMGQMAFLKNAAAGRTRLMLNPKAERRGMILLGKKANQVLFSRPVDPARDWLDIGSFELDSWLTGIDCSVETIADEEGRVVQVTTTRNIGSRGMMQPDPGGTRYEIDQLQLVSTAAYPSGIREGQQQHIHKLLITGKGEHIALTKSRVQY